MASNCSPPPAKDYLDYIAVLRRLLIGGSLDKTYLRALSIETFTFFKRLQHFSSWLPNLSQLRKIELTVQQESVCDFLSAAPRGLQELGLLIACSPIYEPMLCGLSALKDLQVSIRAHIGGPRSFPWFNQCHECMHQHDSKQPLHAGAEAEDVR